MRRSGLGPTPHRPVLLAAASGGSWILLGLALSAASGVGSGPGPGEPPAVTWREAIEVDSGGGHVGPWRMNRSDWRYVDDPTVALDEEGVVAVGWVDQSRKDVFLQVFEPDGGRRFEEPVNVSRSPEIFSWLPRIVIAGEGAERVYVLWQEIVFSGGTHGGEAFFARSTDGGRTFEDPVNLSESPEGDGKGRLTRRHWHNGSLDLAAGPAGDLHAAWTEYEGRLWASRSTDGGASFSAPTRVAGDETEPARAPSLAAGPDGTLHVAWTVGEDPAADIRVATSEDGGRSFAPSRVVHESGGHSDAPKIALDEEGILHAAWGESPDGPLRPSHVRYARSTDGGRTFEEPRELPRPEGVESAGFPALALGGEAEIYLLSDLFPGGGFRPRGLGLTRSPDGGERFAPPAVVPGSAVPEGGVGGSLQGLLMRKLAVNRSGRIAVVQSTFDEGEESRIRLFLGRTDGP